MTDGAVTVEETGFATWDDCLCLSNGTVDLVVTVGLGPRVLRCGFVDGPNLFFTDEDQQPLDGLEPYRIHGGHRLWHAPEDADRTYVPDDEPVDWTEIAGGVRLVAPVEDETGIRKTISIRLDGDEPTVEVTHELANEGVWPVELAPWGVTVLGVDGTAVVPLSAGEEPFLPDRSLALWSYTNPADDRLTFAESGVLVDGDPEGDGRLKLGATGADEWAGYVRDGVGFRTEFSCDGTATYPDRGSAVEVYTDDGVLELETLGPLVELRPGESAVHTERWSLVDEVEADTPAALLDALAPS